MRIPVAGSVLPDTLAAFLPTNFTSLAFFTLSEYSAAVTAPSAPVVLSEDTIQPMLRKSPTVAAVLSLTFGSPVVGLDKSTKPVFLAVVPGTLPPYVSNPDFTLEIPLPPLSKPSWLNFTVFTGVFVVVSAGFVMVMPVGVIFTVLLLSSLNSALVNPLNAGFRE